MHMQPLSEHDVFYIDRRLKLGRYAVAAAACLWLADTNPTTTGHVNMDSCSAIDNVFHGGVASAPCALQQQTESTIL
jgi:hypothetical protein